MSWLTLGLIFIGLAALGIGASIRARQQERESRMLAGALVASPMDVHLQRARASRQQGDIPAARDHYQRVAYGSDRMTDSQRAALTEEVASMTRSDPLYIEGIALVRKQVTASPGILQADLTRGLSARSAEALRYVLYYAEQLGDLVRIKSGRSYRLYLPGQPIPPEPAKPKRTRKSKQEDKDA